MLFEKVNTTSAYIIVVLVLLVAMTSFTLFLINHQRGVLLENEKDDFSKQIVLASEFIRDAISKENFQNVEQFFKLWGEKNNELISVTAVAGNGFTLASYDSGKSISSSIELEHTISGRFPLDLKVRFDVTEIEESIASLLKLVISANILFLTIVLTLLWILMQNYLVRPLKASEEKFLNLASIDALTQINNRRAFYEICSRELVRCGRYKHPLSMLMLDLDHFKSINDHFGHHVGDHILLLVSTNIRTLIRQSDTFGRLGGEEFALCLPEISLESAMQMAERVRSSIANLPHLLKDDGASVQITVSVGYAAMHENEDLDSLLNRCDKALYRAKEAGRNRTMQAE